MKTFCLNFLIWGLLFCACGIYANPSYLKNPDWQKAIQTPEDQSRLNFFHSLYERCQNDQKPYGEIPKVFHVIWLGAQVLPERSVKALKIWMEKHPGWEMKLWTDRDCTLPIPSVQVCNADDFPLNRCADCFYSAESFDERTILLSYAILENEGGVFIDHDAECLHSLEPLDILLLDPKKTRFSASKKSS